MGWSLVLILEGPGLPWSAMMFLYGFDILPNCFCVLMLCPKRAAVRAQEPVKHSSYRTSAAWRCHANMVQFLFGTRNYSWKLEFSRELLWVKPPDISVPNDIWRYKILCPEFRESGRPSCTRCDEGRQTLWCHAMCNNFSVVIVSCSAGSDMQLNKSDQKCFRAGGGRVEGVERGFLTGSSASGLFPHGMWPMCTGSFRVFKTKKICKGSLPHSHEVRVTALLFSWFSCTGWDEKLQKWLCHATWTKF